MGTLEGLERVNIQLEIRKEGNGKRNIRVDYDLELSA